MSPRALTSCSCPSQASRAGSALALCLGPWVALARPCLFLAVYFSTKLMAPWRIPSGRVQQEGGGRLSPSSRSL